MGIQLIAGEKIVWQSFPGARYRTFIFARDFMLFVFISIIFYFGVQEFLPGLVGDKTLLFISVGVTLIGLIFAGITQIQFLLIHFCLTNERLLIKKGFFNRKLTSIKLEHIHDTKVHQNFAERLINTGTIYVFTANDSKGGDDSEDALHLIPSIKNIDEPFKIHQLLEEMLELNAH